MGDLMENESLNKHLAEKVMGWTVMRTSGVIVFANGQRSSMNLSDWNPPENIEQAFMCFKTFQHGSIYMYEDSFTVIIEEHPDEDTRVVLGRSGNESLPMAISIACARAGGYNE